MHWWTGIRRFRNGNHTVFKLQSERNAYYYYYYITITRYIVVGMCIPKLFYGMCCTTLRGRPAERTLRCLRENKIYNVPTYIVKTPSLSAVTRQRGMRIIIL